MGCNYYKVRKLTPEQKEELIEAIKEDRLISIEYEDKEKNLHNIEERELHVHIGKSSVGWKFAFDHNNWKYFDMNKESIEKFINDPSGDIIDEYGDVISPEEFWKMVWKKNFFTDVQGNQIEAWDNQTYEEQTGYKNEYNHSQGDFYIDKLRFVPYTKFC